ENVGVGQGGPVPDPAGGPGPAGATGPPAPGATPGAGPGAPPASGAQNRFPYRLSNTDKSLGELGRSDTAILLDDAFIDTASETPLAVPEHLRARGDPGSYLVQSIRPLDGTFSRQLREAGAAFVS